MDFENYVYKANPSKSKGTISIQKPKKSKRPKIYDPNDSTISINYLKVQSNVTRDAQEFNSSYHEASFDYLPHSNIYTINKNFSSIPNKSDKSSSEISTKNCVIAFIVTFISIAAIVLAVSLPLTLINRTEPIVKNEDSTKTTITTTTIASTSIFYQTTEMKNLSSIEPKNCSNGFVKTSCEECGVSFKKPNLKIVGGSIAVEHSWPSMVFILFNYKFFARSSVVTRKSLCGGTLINRDTILTAAHCFKTEIYYFDSFEEKVLRVQVNEFHPTFESMYTVYLGMQNLSGIYDRNQIFGQKFSIKKFIINPKYDSDHYLNDIAIIKLDEEVTFGEKIQFACLPTSKSINYPEFSNVDAYAVGWGSTIYLGIESYYLRNVKLTLYEGNYCNNVYKEVRKNWTSQICAGEILGGKDTCQGDSGGPLFIKVRELDGKIKFILVGITSYGENCALAGFPAIYTRVNAFRDWISFMANQ